MDTDGKMVLGVPLCDNTASGAKYESWSVNRYDPGLPEDKMLWCEDRFPISHELR